MPDCSTTVILRMKAEESLCVLALSMDPSAEFIRRRWAQDYKKERSRNCRTVWEDAQEWASWRGFEGPMHLLQACLWAWYYEGEMVKAAMTPLDKYLNRLALSMFLNVKNLFRIVYTNKEKN